MVSVCSSGVISTYSSVNSSSSTLCSTCRGSVFGTAPRLSAGSVSCKGSPAVVERLSSSYSSSTAFDQSILKFNKGRSRAGRSEISCKAMGAIQVEESVPQVQSTATASSPETEYPWQLEIFIPPEAVAGFKEDYEAEAKKWPSDIGTTTDFQKLEEFVISAQMLARKWLPIDVVRRLEKFSHDPSQPSVLIIRGLPIDEDLPPTTSEGLKLKVGNYMSETWLGGIARIIGQPFNLRFGPSHDRGMGLIIKDILPTPAFEEKASQFGSSVFLNMHTDFYQAIPECYVDVLAFIGIRGDPQNVGRTLVVDFREIYKRTSAADIKVLREQPLKWKVGDGWTLPVIAGAEDNPQLNLFDEVIVSNFNDLVEGSPDAIAAYKRMKDLARDLGLQHGGVRLEAGDVLLLNQRRVAHGRNEFQAKYNGNDRWLQKVFVNDGQIWQPRGLVPWPERVLPYITVKP